MKGTIFTMAVISAGICCAEIQSANIVGYVNAPKTITAGKVSLGTSPFAKVGTDTVAIQDMLKSSAPAVGYSKRNTDAVQLQVWNGVGYTMYFYLSDAYVEATDDEVEGWAKGNGDYADATIAPGTGYWYKVPKADSTFNLPGQVLDAASVTKDVFTTKLNLVGSPYPVVLDLKNLTTTVPAKPYSQRLTAALQLQVWNGSNYTLYYYMSDAYDEETDDEYEGWAKGNGDMVKGPIVDPSYGMWAKSPSADGKITFVNPIVK